MATSKCPIGVRELMRRQRRLRGYLGTQIADLRTESGVSQATLAAAAEINRGHLSRIERGLAGASVDVLDRIAACLGADLSVRLFPTAGPRLRDRFQAPMIEALIRRLHAGWRTWPELQVPLARGFIDLAMAQGTGPGVACEAHSELRSIDTIQRRLREKAHAFAELDIAGPEVSMLLLVRTTEQTRAVARIYAATLAASFPARAADAFAAITDAAGPWPGPAILWVRVESGRAEILDGPPRGVRVGR
jgi:transcriptional regulator with XRE-family HTH domain